MSQTETNVENEKPTTVGSASATTVPDHSKTNGGTTISGLLHEDRTRSAGSAADETSQATNLDESGDEYSSQQSSATHDPGKMFVGGLSWQTTAEGLRDYFSKFGEVNECMVMRDPTTKRARGFGFITFVDPNTVYKVLELEVHELDGKKIDPKIAFPKKTQPKMVVKTKKVFIGGLSSNSTLDDIKNYFQQFGKIEDAMLMYDKATQRHRGFGFITFDSDEVSDKVCEIHFHEINGKMVECKKAQPKEVMLPVQMNKTRAAAARNLYGLAPEQLLAYASYMPRLPYAPMGSPGMLYPGVFNGFSPQSAAAAFGISPSGRSSVSNSGPLSSGSSGLVNPRDLAAAQAIAQQQAIYEAIAYVNMGGGAADFPGFHPHHHHTSTSGGATHHQLLPPQQHQTGSAHHHLATAVTTHQSIPHQHLHHQNAMAMAAMQHQPPPHIAGSYGKM